MKLSQWGLDDWTLILGYLFTLSFAVSKFYGYELGIGRDVWSLSHDEINRFMRVRRYSPDIPPNLNMIPK
ncbi:hypothetical protein K4K49_003646 [Colletotrichum sp. SAR 10_70]|nr:hypothetical protein K4K50_002336 [Colletotrichum sp. SAR 10_71]KAI8172094.1 hypothetical protein K4K49_003646 [Colletotrichum sp. SAR 10_70]KAI8179304.1 hypothetical protein KHU50_003049 [Colletotrichum sp. SAR 10_65]KAI8215337.1 hypothetical protein K4K52_008183 [Colletotrichum sp. SAR 10_76]KAI8218095.1 hypothetical protein K4K54_010832 [Colletotrichum sp. SAR 10_86]KAI8243285.1 hypothetical protein K4K53_003444 [Colletotrichum sp. SAR 10_77]